MFIDAMGGCSLSMHRSPAAYIENALFKAILGGDSSVEQSAAMRLYCV
jgi:hypothetical protein